MERVGSKQVLLAGHTIWQRCKELFVSPGKQDKAAKALSSRDQIEKGHEMKIYTEIRHVTTGANLLQDGLYAGRGCVCMLPAVNRSMARGPGKQPEA